MAKKVLPKRTRLNRTRSRRATKALAILVSLVLALPAQLSVATVAFAQESQADQAGLVVGVSGQQLKAQADPAMGLSDSLEVTVTPRQAAPQGTGKTVLQGELKNNWNWNNYTTYGVIESSYLVETADGFMRVQDRGSDVLVEYYDRAGTLTSTRAIDNPLGIFGGFFNGENGYYLVFGQMNPEDSDDVVVMTVVRYDKSWNKVASRDFKAINTFGPFDAGSLRMVETGGHLYIHTCHEMYKSSDGLHHQANMTFKLDSVSLEVEDSYTGVMNLSYGYVSHSFNQFIRTDGTTVYRVDHGDFYPRGIAFTATAVDGKLTNPFVYTSVANFAFDSSSNYTGASIGGFELSDTHGLIAWNEDENTERTYSTPRNIFVTAVDLYSDGMITKQQITRYASDSVVFPRTPHLVRIDGRHLLLMWAEYNTETRYTTTKFAQIDNCGKLVSEIVEKPVPLSDCQPIVTKDGAVAWFVSTNRSTKLYSIDPYDLESIETESMPPSYGLPINWADCTVSLPDEQLVYTGLEQRPNVVVNYGEETLQEGADYTIAYANNRNAGTASVQVLRKDTGEVAKTVDFTIGKAKLTATCEDEVIEWDGTPKATVNVVGFVNGETAQSAAGYVAPAMTLPQPIEPGKTYQLTAAGGSASNYEFEYVGATLTVKPKPAWVVLSEEIQALGDTESLTLKDAQAIADLRARLNDLPAGEAALISQGTLNALQAAEQKMVQLDEAEMQAALDEAAAKATVAQEAQDAAEQAKVKADEAQEAFNAALAEVEVLKADPAATPQDVLAAAEAAASAGEVAQQSAATWEQMADAAARAAEEASQAATAAVERLNKSPNASDEAKAAAQDAAEAAQTRVTQAKETSSAASRNAETVKGAAGESRAFAEETQKGIDRDNGLYDLANASVAKIATKAYTGKAIKPAPKVTIGDKTLVKGVDYKLSYKNNVKVGKASVTVTGIGDYTGKASVKFTIKKVSIAKAKFGKVKAQKLKKRGTAVKPKVTVKFAGKKLKQNRDYTLKYKNNKKKGTAKVIVTGKGNFKGKKTLSFKIK